MLAQFRQFGQTGQNVSGKSPLYVPLNRVKKRGFVKLEHILATIKGTKNAEQHLSSQLCYVKRSE